MGIKNFMKFIQKYAPTAIKLTKITDYKNKTLAIDADLMIHKLILAVRLKGYDIKNEDVTITHIHALLLKIIGFKKYNINPIFVFDGTAPELKTEIIKERKHIQDRLQQKYSSAKTKKDKKKYYYAKSIILSREYSDCITILKLFNFTIIEALEEADAQISYLLVHGYADNAVSDDLDLLIFGCSNLLKNFSISDKKYIQEIDLDVLKNTINFNQKQIIDIGILLGCDYCPHIKSIGPSTAYKIIKKYKSIDNLISDVESEHKTQFKKYKKKYQSAQQYFLNPPVNKNIKINTKIGLSENNKLELIIFLKTFKFTQKYIDNLFEKFDKYDKINKFDKSYNFWSIIH